MDSVNQKINKYLATAIANNVDELGSFLQNLMVEAYLQGWNDRGEEDNTPMTDATSMDDTDLNEA